MKEDRQRDGLSNEGRGDRLQFSTGQRLQILFTRLRSFPHRNEPETEMSRQTAGDELKDRNRGKRQIAQVRLDGDRREMRAEERNQINQNDLQRRRSTCRASCSPRPPESDRRHQS